VIYTVRFGLVLCPTNGSVVLYTAPEGVVSVLREVWFSPYGAGTTGWNLELTSGSSSFYVYTATNLELTSTVPLSLRQVIEPGEVLTANQSSTTPAAVWATGYQLS
jgi:hypothetical protein